LWITRISGALTSHDINYSTFMKGLKDSNIDLNRKMLSEMAINDPKAFEQVVLKVKESFKN
jgi:large subunit ribosomal protein L20